jgi:hypothetical protein
MSRKLLVGAAAVALLVSAAHAYQGGDVILDKKDQLTEKDPLYKPDVTKFSAKVKADKIASELFKEITGNPHKVYTLKFKKGDKVVIELKSKTPGELDTVVIVEDGKKNILDFNDDIDENTLDSRLVWTAPADGDYRIIATCLLVLKGTKKYGDFTLKVEKAK